MALDFSEIYDSLKTRIRNPFFGTFIISWLIINWHIPMALIMMSQEDVQALGHKNWIWFIDYHLHWLNAFWKPVGAALVVSATTPFIISGYRILKSRAEDWFIYEQKKNPENRHVKMEKYLELWESYGKKLDQLGRAIEDAEIFKKEREKLEKLTAQQIDDIRILNRKLEDEQVMHNDMKNRWNEQELNLAALSRNDIFPEVFQKEFLFTISSKQGVEMSKRSVRVARNTMWFVGLKGIGKEREDFKLIFCHFSPADHRLVFIDHGYNNTSPEIRYFNLTTRFSNRLTGVMWIGSIQYTVSFEISQKSGIPNITLD